MLTTSLRDTFRRIEQTHKGEADKITAMRGARAFAEALSEAHSCYRCQNSGWFLEFVAVPKKGTQHTEPIWSVRLVLCSSFLQLENIPGASSKEPFFCSLESNGSAGSVALLEGEPSRHGGGSAEWEKVTDRPHEHLRG